MAEFPNYEKLANVVAEKALDEYLYEGKTIREWIKIIAEQEPKADGDCISRETAIDAIEKYKIQPGKLSPIETAFNDGIETAMAEIGHNVPSVNPQETKTGRWIWDDERSDWYDTTFKCSCCGREIIVPYESHTSVYTDYPYCHCGAKMEG